MGHQPAPVPRSLSTLSSSLLDSSTPQSFARLGFHHRAIRLRLSPVRPRAILVDAATPGDCRRTRVAGALDQRSPGILLELRQQDRGVRSPRRGEEEEDDEQKIVLRQTVFFGEPPKKSFCLM